MTTQANPNNNNLPALPDFSNLSIETLDGQTITLAPGQSVLDFLPGGGGVSEPLYRLKVTQGHRDTNLAGKPDTLYLTRKTGRDENARVEVVELGTEVHVWPLAAHANRAYFATKYDPANPAAPDCRSENYMAPDPNIAEPVSHVCGRFDTKLNKFVDVCPMALWGAKDPVTGKSTPPACTPQWVLFFAVSAVIDGEQRMVVAEGYFKSSSGTKGKALVQTIRGWMAQGKPAYSYAVRLFAAPAGQGTTIMPEVVYTQPIGEVDEETAAAFADATQRAEDAIKFRLERSRTMPESEAPAPAARAETPAQTVVTQQATPAPNGHGAAKSNGNGKAKNAEPLV